MVTACPVWRRASQSANKFQIAIETQEPEATG